MLITAECFPTPELLLRSNDLTVQGGIRSFAQVQAEAAVALHQQLTEELRAPVTGARIKALTEVFESAEAWRYRLARASPHRTGRYAPLHAERFRTPITDTNPNYFRIGEHERFRDGVVWDPATRTYVGGAATLASRTMQRFATLAAARFTGTGAEVLQNPVTLPDGTTAGGMRLLCGAPARHAAAQLAIRIAARGGDTSRIVTDGDLLYAASASEADRRKAFQGAMLSLAWPRTALALLDAWLHAAYLLYQAPRQKRGSDATVRVFLVAAGTALLGRPPVLPHDLDLLACVQAQRQFTETLRAAQQQAP